MNLRSLLKRSSLPSLNDAYQDFAVYLLAETSKVNARNYDDRLKDFLAMHGQKTLDQLGAADVDRWRLEMKKRGLKPKSIYGYTQALQTFDRWLGTRYPEYGRITAHIKNKAPKASAANKLPDPDDLQKLKETAVSLVQFPPNLQALRDATIVLVMMETGLRRAETAALHVDLMGLDDPYTETVNGQQARIYEARLPHTKTGHLDDEEQTVDYTEPLAQILRKWLKARPATDRDGNKHPHLFVGVGDCGQHWVNEPGDCRICRYYGQPLSVSAVRFAMDNLCKIAGIKHISAHQLRHAFGQRAIDTGNVEIARQRLRHKDIKTTVMIYGHQDKQRRRRASVSASVLEEISL